MIAHRPVPPTRVAAVVTARSQPPTHAMTGSSQMAAQTTKRVPVMRQGTALPRIMPVSAASGVPREARKAPVRPMTTRPRTNPPAQAMA